MPRNVRNNVQLVVSQCCVHSQVNLQERLDDQLFAGMDGTKHKTATLPSNDSTKTPLATHRILTLCFIVHLKSGITAGNSCTS